MKYFKERINRLKIPALGTIENRPEIQCPVCKEWFPNYNNFSGVKLHIIKKAKDESWRKELDLIKEKKCKHLGFFKKNISAGNMPQILWKI